jgi:hypothetical protein
MLNLTDNHMKIVLSLMMALCTTAFVNAQEDSLQNNPEPDTTNLILGKKHIRIVEKDGETDIKVKDRDENNREDEEFSQEDRYSENENDESDDFNTRHWSHQEKSNQFKGHWNGFQIGINSYLSPDNSTSLPEEMDYMSLNTNKSININLDLFQQSFGIIGKSFGVLSGIGLEFSNYVFDNDNSIEKDETGRIVPLYPGYKVDKSKLVTTYLTVPLLLEFQVPASKRKNRLYINGGIVGGVKLGSHTKIKYKEDGDKQNKKDRDDFNLNALRYGFAGRVGIRNISLYGTYYPVALFEKNKGPELYPFMVGFSFDGF